MLHLLILGEFGAAFQAWENSQSKSRQPEKAIHQITLWTNTNPVRLPSLRDEPGAFVGSAIEETDAQGV